MDYFVSIENTSYHHWQIELLIESFKMHGLEDKLVITIAENNDPKYRDFISNLRSHKRKFLHPNFGKNLNLLQGLRAVCEAGSISEPCVILHPDMVMNSPIQDADDCSAFFAEGIEDLEVLDKIKPFRKDLVENNGFTPDAADDNIPLGNILCIRHDLDKFCFRAIYRTKQLEEKYGPNWNVTKGALILALIDFYCDEYNFRYRTQFLESTLLHDVPANFIHYQHGMPPEFSKIHYKFDKPDSLYMDADPYLPLLVNNPTECTDYVQKVIRSYRGEI